MKSGFNFVTRAAVCRSFSFSLALCHRWVGRTDFERPGGLVTLECNRVSEEERERVQYIESNCHLWPSIYPRVTRVTFGSLSLSLSLSRLKHPAASGPSVSSLAMCNLLLPVLCLSVNFLILTFTASCLLSLFSLTLWLYFSLPLLVLSFLLLHWKWMWMAARERKREVLTLKAT